MFNGKPVQVFHADSAVTAGNPLPVSVTGAVSGSFTPGGLNTGLKVTVVTVNDVAQKVPATALALRNALTLRVWGANNIYFGPSTVTSTNGYPKKQFEELSLDVTDDADVAVWAICSSGQTSELRIMEVA